MGPNIPDKAMERQRDGKVVKFYDLLGFPNTKNALEAVHDYRLLKCGTPINITGNTDADKIYVPNLGCFVGYLVVHHKFNQERALKTKNYFDMTEIDEEDPNTVLLNIERINQYIPG